MMREQLVAHLGEERTNAILESIEPFVYPVVNYNIFEIIFYVLYT